MRSNKWCNENLNATPIKFDSVKGELKELFEVRSWNEFKDEFSDVMYMTLCSIHTYTKIKLPMLFASSTISKVQKRLTVWESIFKDNGLTFDVKYLVNGSNYKRENKVKLALKLAQRDQYIHIK